MLLRYCCSSERNQVFSAHKVEPAAKCYEIHCILLKIFTRKVEKRLELLLLFSLYHDNFVLSDKEYHPSHFIHYLRGWVRCSDDAIQNSFVDISCSLRFSL